MPLNSVDLVLTDGVHSDARVDYEVTMLNLLKVAGYAGSSKVTPVMEGFIGRGLEGSVVTLGRGGSDYTAVTVATLLGVPEVLLVTDVPGLMSIDPSITPKARVVKALDYSEAIETSAYGVKRINPKTFEPVSIGLGKPRVAIGSWSSRGTVIGEGVEG
jgi:aspartate kinase